MKNEPCYEYSRTDPVLNTKLWNHIGPVSIPVGGHFGLDRHREHTFDELHTIGNDIGLAVKAATEDYVHDDDTFTSFEDTNPYDLYCAALNIFGNIPGTTCPHCRTTISIAELSRYLSPNGQKPRKPLICTCTMHPDIATDFTYGINIPSGRMIISKYLPRLIYIDPPKSNKKNEAYYRALLHAYADKGLCYVPTAHTASSIHRNHRTDSYTIGTMPHPAYYLTKKQFQDAYDAVPAHLRPHEPTNNSMIYQPAPEDEEYNTYIMDGDHFDAAMRHTHPDTAEEIRATHHVINITPGYYSITHRHADAILRGNVVEFLRTGDSADYPIPAPTTFTMKEAIDLFRIPERSNKAPHPFDVWHNSTRQWVLGCPAIYNNDGAQHTQSTTHNVSYPAIPCPYPILDQLGQQHANRFYSWIKSGVLSDPNIPIFADIPCNIAPEAIACFIVGADATIHAIQYTTHNAASQLSQHRFTQIYRTYQDFRARLWGAAVTHQTVDVVTAHLDTLASILSTYPAKEPSS